MTELTINKTDGQAEVNISYGSRLPRALWLSLAGQFIMLAVLYYFIDRAQPDCKDSCPMNDYAPWLWVLFALLVLSMAGDLLKMLLLAKGKEHIKLSKEGISYQLKWGLLSRSAKVNTVDVKAIAKVKMDEAPVRKVFGGYLKNYKESPEKLIIEYGRGRHLIMGIRLQKADAEKLHGLFTGFYPESSQKT